MTQSNIDIARDLKQAMSVGDFDQAARIGVKILRLHTKRIDIQVMTAVSEMQGSNPDLAKQRLMRLFGTLPESDRYFGPVAHNFLQFSRLSNDFSSFESALKRRLRFAPQSHLLTFMLADVIFQSEVATSPGRCYAPRLAEAIRLLKKIPQNSARFDEAQKLLARIYLHQEQHSLAFDALEACVSRNQQDLDLRLLLASSYALAGEVQKAVSASLEIIKQKPDFCTQPYVIISFMRPQSMPDRARSYLTAALESANAPRGERYKAAFALAKMEETRGDMKSAFSFYKQGHAANRMENPFDVADELREIDKLVDTAGQPLQSVPDGNTESPRADIAVEGPKPIFIVGMPRSGTTLTERILGAHPDVHAAGEIGDFAKIVAEVVGRGQISDQLARMDAKAAAKIRARYLEAMKSYGPDKRFVTNKTPANFLRVEVIRRVFPDAPIIHTHRYPLATCLSIYTTPFAIPMRYADDLAGLADYYRGYVGLMNTFFETDQNGQLYDLSYEDLVADPEAVARDYLAHCGLEWDPACLEFYRSGSVATTASMIQVRRPIFKDSVEKWQRFEPYIGPLATLAEDHAATTVQSAQKSSRRAVVA